jgi:hypothetical protein
VNYGRHRWFDGKAGRIESLIDDIIISFERMLAAHDAKAEEELQRAARRQVLEARRELGRRRKEREERREKFLERLAADRAEMRRLREWYNDLSADRGLAEAGAEVERLLQWLARRIESLEVRWRSEALNKRLVDEQLFPDPDPLADPVGEPPPRNVLGF